MFRALGLDSSVWSRVLGSFVNIAGCVPQASLHLAVGNSSCLAMPDMG